MLFNILELRRIPTHNVSTTLDRIEFLTLKLGENYAVSLGNNPCMNKIHINLINSLNKNLING